MSLSNDANTYICKLLRQGKIRSLTAWAEAAIARKRCTDEISSQLPRSQALFESRDVSHDRNLQLVVDLVDQIRKCSLVRSVIKGCLQSDDVRSRRDNVPCVLECWRDEETFSGEQHLVDPNDGKRDLLANLLDILGGIGTDSHGPSPCSTDGQRGENRRIA